jgi:cystathionine gamma-lyase
MHLRTKVTRAGLPEPQSGAPFIPGPVFASVFHSPGEPADSAYTYGRNHNPTWTAFESALAELEGGPAISFASGMAAIAAVFGTVLRPGDILALPSDSYFTTRILASDYLSLLGVQVRQAPTAGDAQLQTLPGARLLLIETPSNPGLDVCDIAHLCEIAHREGALVAIDNTTPTVLGQNPLALGADFSLAADTKALAGHSDLLLGHVAVRDQELAEKLLWWRKHAGAIPGPMEVWLAHRSIATLAVRLERACENALKIAAFLSERQDVLAVRYPGLVNDPSYPVASRQMQFFGPIVSFTLPDRLRAETFLASCRLVYEATSYGSVHTSAERRARWGGDAVPEGFIRLSAGIEDSRDLIADIAQALDRASSPA